MLTTKGHKGKCGRSKGQRWGRLRLTELSRPEGKPEELDPRHMRRRSSFAGSPTGCEKTCVKSVEKKITSIIMLKQSECHW